MAGMRRAHRGDTTGVTRGREPFAKRRVNDAAPATLARRTAGDQENDAAIPGECLLKPVIECGMGRRERVAVEIDHHIRDDPASPQGTIPAAI